MHVWPHGCSTTYKLSIIIFLANSNDHKEEILSIGPITLSLISYILVFLSKQWKQLYIIRTTLVCTCYIYAGLGNALRWHHVQQKESSFSSILILNNKN